MTSLPEMRDAIERNMLRGKIYLLVDIYDIVEGACKLDREDFEPQAPKSKVPKWKRNVRNVMQKMKSHET